MIFLLDTNALSALSRQDPSLMEHMIGFSDAHFGVSTVVSFEIYFGAFHNAQTQRYLDRYAALRLQTVPFDENDAREAGRIRAELQRQGTPIGPYDLLIAGQAVARELTLITRNAREFSRVSGLRVENWME